MRILVVHNEYIEAGGEDRVVENEVSLLRENGHEVHVRIQSNRDIRGVMVVAAALGAIFSAVSMLRYLILIRRVRPDVVHVHNFFPRISPAIFYASTALNVPSVHTLHNYRIICPTALLMIGGQATDRSIDEGPWWTVRRRAYRNSLLGTIVVAAMIDVHRRLGTWRRRVDCFVVLSDFAKQKFARAGIPPKKLVVKPNFTSNVELAHDPERSGFLFVGRISTEKGIEVLLEAAALVDRPVCQIKVAGEGPLGSALANRRGITPLGKLAASTVRIEMQRAIALVLPSVWYEGFPMVVAEAYASGLPVIASQIGGLPEMVRDGVTGLLFESGNAAALAEKMAWAASHPVEMEAMGVAARSVYENQFSPEANYPQLIRVYDSAISNRRKANG